MMFRNRKRDVCTGADVTRVTPFLRRRPPQDPTKNARDDVRVPALSTTLDPV
jgi:hypothetical protein